MGQRNTIELILRGTDAGVSAMLGKMTGSLSGLGRVAANALGVLAGNLATAAIGRVSELGRALADDLINEAPRLDQVRRSFENLAAGAGQSAGEILASMHEAANGMVSDAELMQSYNQAMLLVGEGMADKFPALLQIAQASAAATGESVGFLLDSLVRGIGRASPMILDNLGLTIDLGEAYGAYAAQLGITTEEMTKAQQQEALLNAVVAQGGEFVERLGDNTGGAAATIGSFQTTLQNLKDGALAALLPALQELLTPLGELAEEYGPEVVAWAEEAGGWLAEELPEALATLQGWWMATWPEVQAALEDAWTVAEPILQRIAAWLRGDGPEALNTLGAAWDEVWGFIQEMAARVIAWIQENLPLIQVAAQKMVDVWQNNIVPTLDNVWEIIKAIISTAIDVILGILKLGMQIITGDWEGAWETIKEVGASIWGALTTIFNEFLEGVLNAMGTNLEEFKETWRSNLEMAREIVRAALGRIRDFISGFSLRDVGRSLIQGFLDGIRSMASQAAEAARGVIERAIQAARDALGIRSPSAVFAEIGEQMMAGWREGILGQMEGLMATVGMVAGGTGSAAAGVGGGGGMTVVFYGPVVIEGVQDARGLIEELQALAG